MTTLHEAAWGAYVTSQQDQTAAARAVLASVLDPFDVSDLAVVDVDVTPQRTRTTFVNADETVYLRVVVRTSGETEVDLVSPQPGGQWQGLGQVDSLAKLGELLGPPPEGPDEPDYPVWYARWSPDGWPQGSIVWFPDRDGGLYRSTVPDNAWRPDGGYGWEPVDG